MWFLGLGSEPELPATEEDEASRVEMENEESLLGEMNRQMVEAKLQLEAERARVQDLSERLQKAETTLAAEREQWKQEYQLLKDQVGDLSRKNNDLSWSNEELLRMKRSDEAYEELQDTRAMMQALKDLAEDLYKKVALSKVMMIGERRRARLRVSMANWSLAAAGVNRRHALSLDLPNAASSASASPSPLPAGEEGVPTEGVVVLGSHSSNTNGGSGSSSTTSEGVPSEGTKQQSPNSAERHETDDELVPQPPPPPPPLVVSAAPAATPSYTAAMPEKPSRLHKYLLQLRREVNAVVVEVQESIRWRDGLTRASVLP